MRRIIFILLQTFRRGQPDELIVCHLPYGPTAKFNMSDIVMRHDIPNLGNMSEQYPHLIFHNFRTKVGERVSLSFCDDLSREKN